MIEADSRLSVFLSNTKKEVFHSVEHRHQIWRENPFDVESVHEQARAQFQRLLTQATTPPGLDSGRILLLLGESGSGKTHLVRSFRNYAHINGLGFVGYMQMTTAASSYSRYILSNLVDSLDQPYYESLGTTSGLLRLSTVVATRCGDMEAIETLHEQADLAPEVMIDLVFRAADRLLEQPRYAELDQDLVRALLFLQRQDPGLKKRVVKYLRCEDLADRDRKLLGGMVPKITEEDAPKLIEHLGQLMWTLASRSLVICVDQFEDMYQLGDAEVVFRRVMGALCTIADQVPSSVIVISCLEDYYTQLRARLTRSMLDRIENDPAPVRLVSERSARDVEMIIQQRLGYLYETSGATVSPDTPLYPIPRAFVQQLARIRARSVLDECRRFRDACAEAGRIVEPVLRTRPGVTPIGPEQQTAEAAKTKLEQEWNDYLAQHHEEPPEDDADLARLFAWAIETCAEELESGHRFDVRVKGETIEVRLMVPISGGKHRLGEEVLVALCNRAPQGGGLRAQIEGAVKRAEKRSPALIRCGEFPSNPKRAVAQTLAEVIQKGGRKAVVEDSDWRKMAAFREFRKAHEKRPRFREWLMEENHLSRLLPLIHVLDLDHLDRLDSNPVIAAATSPVTPATPLIAVPVRPEDPRGAHPAPLKPESDAPRIPKNGSTSALLEQKLPSSDAEPIVIGTTGELITQSVTLDVEALSAHAAFLGSTGSGKTTLALNVIEQLLLRGIPAVLIDRKGDLCAYAREAAWRQPIGDTVLDERRRALRERLDIALFTPGHPQGRQLAMSLVPQGLAGLEDFERDQAAGYAAQALGDMLGYKHTRKDKSLRAILVQAFQIFGAHGDPDKLDLESLITFIAEADPALVAALGRLDTKLFKDLVQDLETLKLSATDLLSPIGEKLEADLLLGFGAHAQAGRTRLSIISTKFLGDNARILFWVSQLLLSLTRWVTRAPSPRLQAVVLFDEADVYLPAQSQPATKAPMENLLRRARSGGLGLFLATQSPGDLDYKCRDNIRSWFVGRVTQSVALDKMKPLLADARVNVSARIPTQGVGEFHLLQDGRVTGFRGRTSVLRAEQVPENEILTLAARLQEMPAAR